MANINYLGLGKEDLTLGTGTWNRTSRLNPVNTVPITKVGRHTFSPQTRNLSNYILTGAGTAVSPYTFSWTTVLTDLGSNGGTIEIPAAYYQSTVQPVVDRSLAVIGESRDSSVLYTPLFHGIDKTVAASAMHLERFTLLGDQVTVASEGIRMDAAIGNTSQNDVIRSVTIRDFKNNAITMDYCDATIIDQVRILGVVAGAGVGILCGNSRGVTITSAVIGVYPGNGMSITASKGITIQSPFIYDCTGYGIAVDGSDGGVIQSPYIQGGGTACIIIGVATNSTGWEVKGGYIDGNSVSNYGIYVKTSTDCLLTPGKIVNTVTKKIRADTNTIVHLISNQLALTDIEDGLGQITWLRGNKLLTRGAALGFNTDTIDGVGDPPHVSFNTNAFSSANGRGVIAFGAADTSKAVAFTINEDDANYTIILSPIWNAGAVWVTNIAVTGFTANCVTAPGGAGLNMSYMLIRGATI